MISLVAAFAFNMWPHRTELEAVKYAMDAAADCSQNKRECGGGIYEVRQGDEVIYLFSEPVTSDKPFGVDLGPVYEGRAQLPANVTLVADYHVHICNKHNAMFAPFFSESDNLVNEGFHTRGYMLDICTGNIHLYEPGVDARLDEETDFKPHKDGTKHAPIYLTIGRIVGWVDARRLL